MLYGGDLYKGFLDLGLAMPKAPVPNYHLSIELAPLENQAWNIRTYAATSVVAMPTIKCRPAECLIREDKPANTLRLLLYVGELVHRDQKTLLRKAFPKPRIGPIQSSSVDSRLITLPLNPQAAPMTMTARYVLLTGPP